MKIVILGSGGMLGQDLCEVFFQTDNEVVCANRNDVDITNYIQLREFLFRHHPDVVINATAYTNVEACEEESSLASLVNGEAVKNLAEICLDLDTVLIHYSTDYVFDGSKGSAYEESFSPLAPINAYGVSKAIGESGIAKIQNWSSDDKFLKYYLIRTSWLFGKNGKNFVETMLHLGKDRDQLKVIHDQQGSPTYTHDLAKRTLDLLDWNSDFGIYHVTNCGICSWHDFAEEIFKQKGIEISLEPIKTEEFKLKANRPRYSALKNTKLPEMRHWKEALNDYLENI